MSYIPPYEGYESGVQAAEELAGNLGTESILRCWKAAEGSARNMGGERGAYWRGKVDAYRAVYKARGGLEVAA